MLICKNYHLIAHSHLLLWVTSEQRVLALVATSASHYTKYDI
jgi:hypothetical protein